MYCRAMLPHATLAQKQRLNLRTLASTRRGIGFASGRRMKVINATAESTQHRTMCTIVNSTG